MSDQTMAAQEPLPEIYQEADVNEVFRWLKRGESCALVGIGSVGKSNLLQFMLDDRVKQKYGATNVITVLLDPHKLVRLQRQALELAGTAWPGYEIMISRLRRAVLELYGKNRLPTPTPGQPDVIDEVQKLYLNLFHSQPLLVQSGIRHLEESVYEVLQLDKSWKIAFLFDEFEGFCDLPPEFFESLRGVRDEFKYRVMYVTTSRRDPEELVTQWRGYANNARALEIMEGFFELFRSTPIYLRLLDEASAVAMLRRLAKRHWNDDRDLADWQRQDLMQATGRHVGLMRRCFMPVARQETRRPIDELCQLLLRDEGVVKECIAILDSLTQEEQDALWYAARGKQIRTDVAQRLQRKHLGQASPPGYLALYMPVLRHFVWNRPEPKPVVTPP